MIFNIFSAKNFEFSRQNPNFLLVLSPRIQPFLDIFKKNRNGLRRNIDIKITSNGFAHFHHAFSVCSICQNQNLKKFFSVSAVCLHFCTKFSCLFTFFVLSSAVCLHSLYWVQLFVYIFVLSSAVCLRFCTKFSCLFTFLY